MSRPEKNADARRSHHVIFRLTAQEYDRLSAIAARAGLAPNELARRLIRKRQGRLIIQTIRHCDPALLKRIEQIGHNLNQIVKNAHIFGRVSERIDPLCATIAQLIMQALEETDGS